MSELPPATADQPSASQSVFISYATANRKQALSVCKAIESRGTRCWLAARNVEPGDNYQEAIVHAIRNARAVVLVFSDAANNSDEIKKELSLASRFRVPVIALRIEDVEPGDAFAYELSTRQWIDAFEGWDQSIDALVGRIGRTSVADTIAATAGIPAPRRAVFVSRRPIWIAVVALLLLALAAGAWWMLRRAPAAAHSMTIRLADFQLLSADVPATMGDTVRDEILAAFNDDGVVGVSTAPAPPPGTAPAYVLGGTIQRDADTIRVIARLTNERSGATLWSNSFNYGASQAARVPRHVAVDAGNVIRCGLFGASTYRKALPDAVVKDYLQFCEGHWDPNLSEGRKALIPAQRVVAAVPDFSWGWAAVAGAYWKVAENTEDDKLAEQARASGRDAADRALTIDRNDSEALWIKSLLIDRHDWAGREKLLKRAVAARSLDCGCEHHQYGDFLVQVGRTTEALDQFRQASDMLALYVYTAYSLAKALVVAGKPEEAKASFDAAIDLAPDSDFANQIALSEVIDIGGHDARAKALRDRALPISPDVRAALLSGFDAVATGNSDAKKAAAQSLLALPQDEQDGTVARLLGDLGADRDAFQLARRLVTTRRERPTLFWYPAMRASLASPGFPKVAEELGLLEYWKTTHTRPDVCLGKDAPPFCRSL